MPTRRKFLTQSSLTLGAVGFLKPLQAIAGTNVFSQADNTVTLLFTNGLNGNMGHVDAGINAVNELVKNVRRTAKNVVLLDSGNSLQAGTTKSINDLYFFKSLKETGYDLITPGTADLQHGPEYFTMLLDRSRVSAVSAHHTTGESITGDRILRKGALRIGVIGVGGNTNVSASSFRQLGAAINGRAEKLKQIHCCQLVVLLSHLPLKNEETGNDNFHLAEASANIDVVISAQDERFTYNTHIIKNSIGQDVILSHAGKEGSMLGKLAISLNEKGEKTGIVAEQLFAGYAKNESSTAFRRHAASQFA